MNLFIDFRKRKLALIALANHQMVFQLLMKFKLLVGTMTQRVITSLLDGSCQESFSAVAVVGKGGLGKTALVMTAYNDSRVAEHFDLRIWINVHDDFNLRRITKSIIDNAAWVNYDLLNFNSMQQRLEEVVSGKRFLLVLDEAWNESQDMWDYLAIPLRSAAKEVKF